MRTAFLFAILILLPGAAMTQPAEPNAMRPWVDCLFNAAQRLDDGKSDAHSIASGVVFACRSEFQSSIIASTQKLPAENRAKVQQQVSEHQVEAATRMVLELRSVARNKK